MAVLHLVRHLADPPAAPRRPARAPPPGRLRSCWNDRDGHLVTRLARDAARRVPQLDIGPQPRPAGLVAELAGRAGREVEAWLAVDGSTGRERALGVVTLVTCWNVSTPGPACPRHSLGWLVVHPTTRRHGLGRLLVTRACERARELGADRVWVEVGQEWSAAVAFWRALGFAPPTRSAC